MLAMTQQDIESFQDACERYQWAKYHAKPTVAQLVQYASRIYGVPVDLMLGKNKTARVARARQWVMYHAVAIGKLSVTDIGKRLGGRHHSTVIHGARQHAWRHNLTHVCQPGIRTQYDRCDYEGPEPVLEL